MKAGDKKTSRIYNKSFKYLGLHRAVEGENYCITVEQYVDTAKPYSQFIMADGYVRRRFSHQN